MQIYIYDRSLNLIGLIDNYYSLRWRRRYNQYSEFELHCPLTTDTITLLLKDNVICKSDNIQEAGFINYRELQQDALGQEFLIVKGRFLNSYFDRRIIWGTEIINDTVENAMRTLITHHAITPTDSTRTIPNLVLGTLKGYPTTASYQTSYQNLFDELTNLGSLSGVDNRILFDSVNKKLSFDVYTGLNRSVNQSINPRCIFSKEFENVLTNDYIDSINNYKDVALVAGVGQGSARKIVTVGAATGLDRLETFVDAASISNINPDTSTMTDAVYLPMLTTEGNTTLSTMAALTTFDSKINLNSNLKYKTDFDLGDIVTVTSKKWGITLDSRITEIEEVYDENGLNIDAIFGNNIPTLLDLIKQNL